MRIRGKEKVPALLQQADAWIHQEKNGLIPIDRTIFTTICLEVGCGKGVFLSELASRHKDIFYLGIDKFVEIIARAATQSATKEVNNVLVSMIDVERIESIVAPSSIQTIYLNFSDPWPRRKNEKRRLTYPRFLDRYAKLLVPGGCVEMKTDNADLFIWSLQSFTKAGWTITESERALSATAPEGLEGEARYIKTEYETRFRGLGVPICFLRATPPKQ